MKNKISIIVIIIIALTMVPVYGDFYTIYDEISEDYINQNIINQRIVKYTDQGPIEINLLKIKLDENNFIEPIYNKEEMKEKKPLSFITSQNKAVASINGDFYNMGYPSFPYGALIYNKQIISSPNSKGYNYPTLIKRGENYIFEILEDGIYLENRQGQTINISAVNKLGEFNGECIILNDKWGKTSLGSHKNQNLLEVLVLGNTVKEIRKNGEAFDIPKDGFVIVTNQNNEDKINDLLEINSEVKIKYNFDLENMDWGFGGVNYLVKEGKLHNINPDVKGRQPRSAIAFNEDKSEIYFITIDGRSKNSIGVTQNELAVIIINLGGYDAMNLDGGGTTTLAAQKYDDIKVLNVPSDGNERYLVSGIGAFSTYKSEDKEVKFIKGSLDSRYNFKNQNIKVNIRGYNKYLIPVEIDEKLINLDSNLESKNNENNIIIEELGSGKIIINYEDLEDEVDVEIIEGPFQLDTDMNYIKIGTNEEYKIKDIYGIGDKGRVIKVNPQDIEWIFNEEKGKLEDGIFKSFDYEGQGILEGRLGDSYIQIPVSIGYDERLFYDFENIDNLYYSEYPENSGGRLVHFPRASQGRYSAKLNYDFTKMVDDDQAIAFVNFKKNGTILPNEPKIIKLSVFGDKKSHWLRARITDAEDNLYKIDLAEKVNWWGWKEVTGEIPKEVVYPIKLQNIYIAEIYNDMKDSGSIYLDDLRLIYLEEAEDIEVEKSIYNDNRKIIPESYDYKFDYNDNKLIYKNEIYNNQLEDIEYYELNIENNSMIKNLEEIKNLLNLSNKRIIIKTNEPIENLNKNEYKGLIKLLENSSEKNKDVIIITNTDKSESINQRGFTYIKFIEDLQIFMDEGNSYYEFY